MTLTVVYVITCFTSMCMVGFCIFCTFYIFMHSDLPDLPFLVPAFDSMLTSLNLFKFFYSLLQNMLFFQYTFCTHFLTNHKYLTEKLCCYFECAPHPHHCNGLWECYWLSVLTLSSVVLFPPFALLTLRPFFWVFEEVLCLKALILQLARLFAF